MYAHSRWIYRNLIAFCALAIWSSHAFAALLWSVVPPDSNGPTPLRIVSFTSTVPGTLLDDFTPTGLLAGETVLAIDFHPVTGELFALGSTGVTSRLLKIDLLTRAASSVGAVSPALNLSDFYGMSFEPTNNSLRVVSSSDMNWLVDSSTGSVTMQSGLAFPSGDPNFGTPPDIVSIAHDNKRAGATHTTTYGIDRGLDRLLRIGDPGGVVALAASGKLSTIGPLGVNATGYGGFDIEPGTNNGYAVLRVGGASQLYRINLHSGAATLVGTVGSGTDPFDALAISPPDSCLDVDGNGAIEATKDGVMLVRAMLGMRGDQIVAGLLSRNSTRRTWADIRKHLNSNACGGNYAP